MSAAPWPPLLAVALLLGSVSAAARAPTPGDAGSVPRPSDAGSAGAGSPASSAPATASRADAGAALRTAAVVVGDCDAPASHAVLASFRDALRGRPGFVVLGEPETAAALGGMGGRPLPELHRALTAARNAFFAGRAQRSLQELARVEEEALRTRPSDARWALLREVLAARAQVQLKADPPGAERTFRRLLSLEPEYAPDPGDYPPSYVKRLSEVRTSLKTAPTNRLDVRSEPAGVPVYVGGRPVGKSPQSLRMPPGDWWVEADFGRRGMGRLVTVPAPPDPPNAVTLAQAVEGSVDPGAGPCIASPGRPEALARVFDRLGVERLLVLRSDATRLRVGTWNPRTRSEIPLHDVELPRSALEQWSAGSRLAATLAP